MPHPGQKYGRLTVRKEESPNIYLCDCTCGNLVAVWESQLACKVQRDCGMCRRPGGASFRKRNIHGHTRAFKSRDGRHLHVATHEYFTWSMMIRRCMDKKFEFYPDYGGRGIRVCKRWQRGPDSIGFINFLKDMGPRPCGKTLDRINPQGHYEPTNCRWADWKTQRANQRRTVFAHCKTPSVESIRAMEKRIEAEYDEMHPF